MHLVITDSGLGGIGICAAVERDLRLCGRSAGVRLTYFSAWPEEHAGYNSLPDVATQVSYFDRALDRMTRDRPDRIVIACNTLSVLYPHTVFARAPLVPVVGIIDTGIEMFHRALIAEPLSSIALFGTRITIESGVHRDGLLARGVTADRIAAAGCHGLAAAIEKDVSGSKVDRLIGECVATFDVSWSQGGPLFAGLCCTHFGFVGDRFQQALERRFGRPVTILDPNQGLADAVVGLLPVSGRDEAGSGTAAGGADGCATVSVLSKVRLDEHTRTGIGRLVEEISPLTARALAAYRHVPDLF